MSVGIWDVVWHVGLDGWIEVDGWTKVVGRVDSGQANPLKSAGLVSLRTPGRGGWTLSVENPLSRGFEGKSGCWEDRFDFRKPCLKDVSNASLGI
jgi:hypothetical protein